MDHSREDSYLSPFVSTLCLLPSKDYCHRLVGLGRYGLPSDEDLKGHCSRLKGKKRNSTRFHSKDREYWFLRIIWCYGNSLSFGTTSNHTDTGHRLPPFSFDMFMLSPRSLCQSEIRVTEEISTRSTTSTLVTPWCVALFIEFQYPTRAPRGRRFRK